METPIADFLAQYAQSGTARFHMPGHKGHSFVGCEAWDITEVAGADSLYEAEDGIIAQSEHHATALFGTGRTLYSTEGSSQCIRAMLHLVLSNRPTGTPPVIVAARNVHKAFVYAAALLDFEIVWLWPEESFSLCSCHITPKALEETLRSLSTPPAAVYLTSPDYLGGMADISALAEVCHRFGTLLTVDNAHGAYLHFLQPSLHPLNLGADICCDSAHKTLPVLTGGAYLHIASRAPKVFCEQARSAMALFGSTSPSYLTLASLDLCNRYIASDYPAHLATRVEEMQQLRNTLTQAGWTVMPSDPLRLTIRAPKASSGYALAQHLRKGHIECEYADPDFVVLMVTPENPTEDLHRIAQVLYICSEPPAEVTLPLARGERVLSVRQALFAPQERIPAQESLGRVCGTPAVSCPPAIPIAVTGERIREEALQLFARYGITSVDVLR